MTVVIDTSVLIDHLRGDSRARSLLASGFAEQARLVGSVLTRMEILAGLRNGEEIATTDLLGLIEWVAADQGIADRAGELGRVFLRSHPGVDPVDLIIAATVERLGASLWTRNVKHLPMFPDLRAPYAT
ncbi:MAG: type II toxin-antitoxin system VapC family toxin [Chloroflexota bacterium]|nr:MAG: type II toxin-antitoxin system VapC family toxin [Chloroflexota bacterium]